MNGDLRGFTVEGTGDRAKGEVQPWKLRKALAHSPHSGPGRTRAETPLCSAAQGSGRREALLGVASPRPGAILLQDERGPWLFQGPTVCSWWLQAGDGAGRAPGSLLVEDAENGPLAVREQPVGAVPYLRGGAGLLPGLSLSLETAPPQPR